MNNNKVYLLYPFNKNVSDGEYTLFKMSSNSTYCLDTCISGLDINKDKKTNESIENKKKFGECEINVEKDNNSQYYIYNENNVNNN